MIHVLGSVQKEVSEYLKKYSSQEGWLTEFNFRHNYSSPFRVNEGLDEHSRMSYLVTSLIKQAQVNKVLQFIVESFCFFYFLLILFRATFNGIFFS